MKKTSFIFLASLVALITILSCQKENTALSDAPTKTILTALVGQGDTKTNISSATEGTSANVVWTSGDKLTVLGGLSFATAYEFTLSGGDNTASGIFSCSESVTGDVIAIYPYAATGISYTTDKVLLNIPETQAYTAASFAQGSVPMVAYGDICGPLDFKYLFSVIAFKVQGTGKNVDKITVAATTPLWGPAEITGYDGATPTLTMTGAENKYFTVTLNCATAQSIDSDKVFFIAVPAGSYTLAVNVYCGTEVFHTNYTTAKTFTKGNIKYNSAAKSFTNNGAAYVDGTFIGESVKIGDVNWSPVNCGYDPSHPLGLLYQWGRKYGQAYEAGTITPTDLTMAEGQLEANKDLFAKENTSNGNWFPGDYDNTLWLSDTKSIYDPCPKGWKVPSYTQMQALMGVTGGEDVCTPTLTTVGGVDGCYFDGTQTPSTTSGVFLPIAGMRFTDGSVGLYGRYWNSKPGWIGYRPQDAAYMYFSGSGANNAKIDVASRASGRSIRCVQE